MASTSTNGPMYKIDPAHHFQSIALQVWAYESIPTITECGVHKVSNDAIPRMLRWVCELSPKSHVLQRQVFDSPMFLINVVIEMMPEEEEHLRMSSGELVEKTHPYNTVSEKNGDSKRPGEASNDDNDCKKSKKKKKWKSKMKEVVRKLKYRVAVLENERESLKSMLSTILKHLEVQKKGEEGDCTGVEGHDAQTEDVDTPGTPSWLRMPKEDDTSDGVKHVERQKQGVEANRTEDDTMDELDKKVHIHSEEPVDVVDDLNEEIGVKSLTYFDSDVMEIEPLSTERPHVRPARSKRASVYLSTPFTALDKRTTKSITTTSQSQPSVYDPMHKIPDAHLDRLRAWITDKRTKDEVRETFHGKKSKEFFRDLFMCRRWLADEHLDALFLLIRFNIKTAMIPTAQNFTTVDTLFMRLLVAKWPEYQECIKENRPFHWKEEYRLVDYVVGSKQDCQDPWVNVDYIYSPFNIHGNHWILLCLDFKCSKG
ncbi:uncharacterized protein LOC116405253 isoform X2 [Cucumis sativus]|uniref:uncharacterized protein LOC116402876 isoform X2 n=1 Tax=Cucumis sativus TaxID=3659 RepID=UPI0012F4E224|nr:uncharacterized protein LOC116402876 isoform X2 [Cucumis sativus]XP_031739162.1 uncharacterized protein LOC116402876 isoform X2 [Cucumis sativus]XP_031745086.1 uncharacterized protein LOC116405253 isoform X2 [Cucumis sativus]XP_031745089.1 uncharacterized protein LOC116405253 isoform X2 [Cucumis sativus]